MCMHYSRLRFPKHKGPRPAALSGAAFSSSMSSEDPSPPSSARRFYFSITLCNTTYYTLRPDRQAYRSSQDQMQKTPQASNTPHILPQIDSPRSWLLIPYHHVELLKPKSSLHRVTDPRKQSHAPLAADPTLATTGPRTAVSREIIVGGGDQGGEGVGGRKRHTWLALAVVGSQCVSERMESESLVRMNSCCGVLRTAEERAVKNYEYNVLPRHTLYK